MTKPDTFMPWFIADYMADTQHLSRDQHGGYMLLLGAYWRSGQSLPDDDARLAQIAKATPSEWRKLRPILSEFFTVSGGRWSQKRQEQELARAIKNVAARSNAGVKGAAARWQTHANAKAWDMPNEWQNDGPPPPPLPESTNSESSLEFVGSPSGKPKTKRGVRLPEDFEIPAAWFNDAEAARCRLKLPLINYEAEAVKFLNWAANAKPKLDWRRAWINWCISDYQKGNSNGSGQSGAIARIAGKVQAAREDEARRSNLHES